MFVALTAIVGGVIASAAIVTKFVPNSGQLIDKLTPYTGWIGVVMFFYGAWGVIGSVLSISLLSQAPIFWIVGLAAALSLLGVGFLLGFGLITKYALSKNEQALAKGQAIRAKLVPFQAIMGLVSIGVGVLYFVARFIL